MINLAINYRTNKEGKKIWHIDYYDNRGKRIRETIGTSKKLAETVLQKRKVQIAENRFLDIKKKPKITLKELINLYLKEFSKPNKRSYIGDVSRANNLLSYFGENKLVAEITPLDIEKFKAYRKDKVKPATINRELALLKHVYTKGIEWGKVFDNPVKKVKLFKEDNRRSRFLSQEEIGRLLACANGQLKAILITALHTGMRRSEIFNLKWKDIDFETGYITVLNSKNGEKRDIPLSATLTKTLKNVIRYIGSEYVFRGKHGELVKDISRSFATTLSKAAITDFRFHDFRHTFASHLVMKGTDLKTVQELLGHRTFEMTLRYSHLSPDHKRKAIQNMDTIWSQEGKSEIITSSK